MKLDTRSYNQKAREVLKNSAQLAFRIGTELSEKVKETEQLNDNILTMHRQQCNELDKYFELLHNETSTHPSCGEYCSGCCKYPIWSTEVEYLDISQWISENISEERMDILNKNFEKWDEEIGELASQYLPGDSQKHNEYVRKNIKCPFLIDNSCSIYEARPVNCRTYFSYGNPRSCEKEMFPSPTLNLSCAKLNIYTAPLANKVKKVTKNDNERDEKMATVLNVKLLPFWFV